MTRTRLSSPAIAERLGIADANVRAWRNGARHIPSYHIAALLTLFAEPVKPRPAPSANALAIRAFRARKLEELRSRSPVARHLDPDTGKETTAGRVARNWRRKARAARKREPGIIEPAAIDRRKDAASALRPAPAPKPMPKRELREATVAARSWLDQLADQLMAAAVGFGMPQPGAISQPQPAQSLPQPLPTAGRPANLSSRANRGCQFPRWGSICGAPVVPGQPFCMPHVAAASVHVRMMQASS